MLYKVKYKKPGALFWSTVRKVIGDSSMESPGGAGLPSRVLLLEDNTRMEIPMTCVIKFSKEREEGLVKQSQAIAEAEAMKKEGAKRVIPGRKTKQSMRSH